MIKLYYSPGSCALASHIALEEAGADYEAVRIDFGSDEQKKPDFLAINPKGRVPALVSDKGILTETPAILIFISQTYPASSLAPVNDPWALAQAQAFNSYLCATVHVAHAHGGRGHRWADKETSFEDMRQKVQQTVGDCYTLIENDFLKGPWVLGDTYSICDMYLYTVSRWLARDRVEISKFPKVKAQFAAIEKRPAVARVLENHFAD